MSDDPTIVILDVPARPPGGPGQPAALPALAEGIAGGLSPLQRDTGSNSRAGLWRHV